MSPGRVVGSSGDGTRAVGDAAASETANPTAGDGDRDARVGSGPLDSTRPRIGPLDREAVFEAVPLVLGAAPFALVTGLAMTRSGMPTFVAWLTSPLIFAGAAQLAMMTLAGSVSMAAVIGALAIINARHVMYSAALATEFGRHPRWFRVVGAALIIDQNFALSLPRFGSEPAAFRRYYLSVSAVFYTTWLTFTSVGTLIGPAFFRDSWHVEFAIPILFLGLTVGIVKTKAQLVAASVGAAVGLLTSGLPDRLGVVCGAIAGVAAGSCADAWFRSHRRPTNVEQVAMPSNGAEADHGSDSTGKLAT